MFNKSFFPTPPDVAKIMLSGLSLKGHILDPSAGKGDLLDMIANYSRNIPGLHRDYQRGKDKLYAIEIEPDLRAILNEKGYTVIDSDFLSHPGHRFFDFIIMNPPFEDGAKHLLKAWDDVSQGATIRCLLNSETLNNAHTQERKRLKQIIGRYGWTKSLGQAFRNAERPTDVFVTLVHLRDTREGEAFRLDFEPKKLNGRHKFEDIEEKGLAPINVFESFEAQYNAGIEAFKELLLARQKVDFFLDPLLTEYKSGRNLVAEALKNSHAVGASYQTFLKDATRAAWDNLFTKTKLNHVTTEGVRKELEKMQSQQGLMSFTASNMEALFNSLFASREQIMKSCIVDAFNEICKYYDENREYVEGWKTNSSYFAGKRFILPNMGATYHDGMSYDGKRTVVDIEKALSFLEGISFDSIKYISIATVYDRNAHYGEKMQSAFFETKLYRKGTLHFRWLDEDLRQRFNMVAAQELWGNRVPEHTKKGAYK